MLMTWNMQRSSACIAAEQVAVGADQEMRLLQSTAAAKHAEMFRAKVPCETEDGSTLLLSRRETYTAALSTLITIQKH